MIKTIRGVVSSNANEYGDGSFLAVFREISDAPLIVYMTSPYYRQNSGGMLAIPDEADEILAYYDEDSDEIFYQSTILKGSPAPSNSSLKNFRPIPRKVYSTEGKPVKVTYQNNAGAGLDITRDYNVHDKKIVSFVQLVSESGKRIALDDSPEVDATILRNQHGDGVTVQGDANSILPERSITTKSHGPQYFTSFEGGIEMRVVDGRDIVLENNSTGANTKVPSVLFWPNGPESQPPKRYGGIYLRSSRGDISLSTKAQDGRMYLVTPKARIQITEDGSVIIDSASDIQLRSDGNIKIKAEGDINMEGQNIDLNALGSLTQTAGAQAAISSSADMSIDGATVNLNSGALNTAQPPDLESPELNDYSE